MTILTKRSALRLELAQLDATKCGDCGHALARHLNSDGGCADWDLIPHPEGYKHGSSKQKFCRCSGFVSEEDTLDV